MDCNTSAASIAAPNSTASAWAVPPPRKRRRQPYQKTTITENCEENSHLHQKQDDRHQRKGELERKRRKSSITPSTTIGTQRQARNHQPLGQLDNGGRAPGNERGAGGRTPHYDMDTRRRTAERGAETRPAEIEARYQDGSGLRGATSKPDHADSGSRHYPPIGSFKPPPRPTRIPLAQIRNQNNRKTTNNNEQSANFKNARTKSVYHQEHQQARGQEKSKVTYVENHKGELEIIKYKNTKRGSVVAFSPDITNLPQFGAQGQQHRQKFRHLQEANLLEQEQNENEHHKLQHVDKPRKREYSRELYCLFKRDLRDWEEQEGLVQFTGLMRENIAIDPRLLEMENQYSDLHNNQVWVEGEPPKAAYQPETSSQQQIQQPRANEPQFEECGRSVALKDLVMRGQEGGLLSRNHYSLDLGNGLDTNNNSSLEEMGGNRYGSNAGNGSTTNLNHHTPAPRGVYYGRVDGAEVRGERGYGNGQGNDASAGHRNPVHQLSGFGTLLEQTKQMYGFSLPTQHGVRNFVELSNAERYKMQDGAQEQEQQNQQNRVLSEQMNKLDGVQMMGPGPMVGAMGPPAYHMQNLHAFMPFGHYNIASIGQQNGAHRQNAQANPGHFLQQPATGFGHQNSDRGEISQAGSVALIQEPTHIYGAGIGVPSASPALFMHQVSKSTSSFSQWDASLSPPRMGAFMPEDDFDPQNAFANQDADVEMADFSPHRGPVEFEGLPMSPLMFQAHLPEHTFAAQQAFAHNGQHIGGSVPGPWYAQGHDFLNGDEVGDGPTFQLDPGTAAFLQTYHTLPQVRERFDQLILAQYPPHAVSLHMMQPTMPMSIRLAMQMPPLPAYPPLQMGLQQPQTYNGPCHLMLSNNQSNQANNSNYHGLIKEGTGSSRPYLSPYPSPLVNNYVMGQNSFMQNTPEQPKPTQPFKFTQQSAGFSPSRSPMVSNNIEEPKTPHYTHQQVINSQASPETFRIAHRRHRNSFESLLYMEYLAKVALKLDNKNGHMAVEVTPKTVAQSYTHSPHSGRGRSSNAKTMPGCERCDLVLASAIDKATRGQRKSTFETPTLAFREKTRAGEFNGFNERAKYTDVAEKTIASAHLLSLADRSRRQEAALVANEDVTDSKDLDDPPSSYNRETGIVNILGVDLSKKESAKAITMAKCAVARTGGTQTTCGGRSKGLAYRHAPPPTLHQEVLAWQMPSAKKHSAGLEKMYEMKKTSVDDPDREVMGFPPLVNNETPAPPPRKRSHKKNVGVAPVVAEPPFPARVLVVSPTLHV